MGNPTVSVVLPVFNCEKYIEKSVNSILNQSFDDLELLIIDDGSTDKSLEICKKYALTDSRVVLVSRENRGLIDTLNEGIHLSRGIYIARMDADDISHTDRLRAQVAYLESNQDCAAVGTCGTFIDTEGDPLLSWNNPTDHEAIDNAHFHEMKCSMIHPSVMMRKTAVLGAGGYNKGYIHAEDFALWLRMAELGKLANLPDSLIYYRVHINSISHKWTALQEKSALQALADAMGRRNVQSRFVSNNTPDKSQKSMNEVDYHRLWGYWALSGSFHKSATKYAIKTILKNPTEAENWRLALHISKSFAKKKILKMLR